MTLPFEFALRSLQPRYFRRDGSAYPPGDLGLFAWARDFHCFGTRVVDESWTIWGDRVSTVWLGLDHGFGIGERLIFETMIFDRNGESILCDRYVTEAEALDGHKHAYWLALIPPPAIRFLQKRFGYGRSM